MNHEKKFIDQKEINQNNKNKSSELKINKVNNQNKTN